MQSTEPDQRLVILVARAIAIGAFGLIAVLTVRHAFNKDEIENVHSAWLVASGLRPYTDFFQHHQPLLWDAIALVLPWIDQSASALIVFRLFMFVCLVGIVVITYRLASAEGPLAAWAALALLLTLGDNVRNAYVIRPEVPATLCAVAAAWLFVPRDHARLWHAAAGGGLLALATLFSLKSAPLAALDGVILTVWWHRRTISPQVVVVAVIACLAPLVLFMLRLIVSGSLHDFYLATWVANLAISSGLDNAYSPGSMLFVNLPFWIVASLGALWVLSRRQRSEPLEISALNGLGLLVVLALSGRSESRSVWSTSPFLAVTAGSVLATAVRRIRVAPVISAAALVGLVAAPLVDATRQLSITNNKQMDLIGFVLARTPLGEPVLDGRNQFNLFRPDVDYYWFYPRLADTDAPARAIAIRTSIARMLGRDPEDVCDLVRKRRPHIVSATSVDLEACGLTAHYAETPYPGVFERRDSQVAARRFPADGSF